MASKVLAVLVALTLVSVGAQAGPKWRFRDETKHGPQLAIYPQVLVPTGSASRGLGAGKSATVRVSVKTTPQRELFDIPRKL